MKKLKEIFTEYKKSIKWTMFFGWCLLFNFGLSLDNWSIFNFFLLNLLFFVISIAVYLKWKYKLY